MNIFSYIRHCAFCHRATMDKTDLFCENCWQKLVRHRRKATFPLLIQGQRVYPLFIWSEENLILEKLLYALKGGGLSLAFDRLVTLFLFAYGEEFKNYSDLVFVPVPPTLSKKFQDHAYCLAETMARKTQGEIKGLLKWVNKETSQKWLRKKERLNLKMEKVSPIKTLEQKRIIIIDDVVTTGATIRAASEALGESINKEIWCLAYRI